MILLYVIILVQPPEIPLMEIQKSTAPICVPYCEEDRK